MTEMDAALGRKAVGRGWECSVGVVGAEVE